MNHEAILVIEDDYAIRNLITTTLETNQYKFKTATTGAQAMTEAVSKHLSLIHISKKLSVLPLSDRNLQMTVFLKAEFLLSIIILTQRLSLIHIYAAFRQSSRNVWRQNCRCTRT